MLFPLGSLLFSLDDKLSDYMPEFKEMMVETADGVKKAEKPILIKHLFEMTAGFSYNCCSDKLEKAREETTDQIYIFEEMELGTYYLVQVNTLEGYSENTKRVKFVVSEDEEIVKVEVKNKLKSEEKPNKEKDAFALELPLLCSVAMFDIALCIGIIVYVKKRKQKSKK